MEAMRQKPRVSADGRRLIKLKDVVAPVAGDLRAFRRHYRRYLRSGIFVIDEVAAYLLRTRGKGMRPTLTLLSARACGAEGPLPERTLTAALVTEILHTATLVHDDVVDRADERRGKPSLNLIFNNKVAVLFGDLLLARSLHGMLAQRSLKVLDLFADCAIRLAQGELIEAISARRLDLDKSAYFRMVSDKTASLISAACQIGPISLGYDDEWLEPLKRYGELVGVAFQVRDDLLDLGDGGSKIGKPTGLDLVQAKLTLPLIHTLEHVSRSQQREILVRLRRAKRVGKRGESTDLSDIVALIYEKGGVEYARDVAVDYAAKASASLAPISESVYRDHLQLFARFAAERNR